MRQWRVAFLTSLVSVLLTTMLPAASLTAQTGGQFWVRAFEDLNENGIYDEGDEPLLTRGIGINLQDANGVILASALLDDSPNAADGLVGFQFLPPGQYAVEITSAVYEATTDDVIAAAITESETPTVVDFGGRRVEAISGAGGARSPQEALDLLLADSDVLRVVASAIGALTVMCGMGLLGLVIYLLVVRGLVQQSTQPAYAGGRYAPPTTTGRGQPVPTFDDYDGGSTGEFDR